MQRQLRETQAQLIDSNARVEKMNAERLESWARSNVSGHGLTGAGDRATGLRNGPSREDLAPFAKAKIEATGLGEICQEIADARGVSIDKIVGFVDPDVGRKDAKDE